MTDIALDASGDLIILEGQIPLLGTTQEFVEQRIQISLRTISGDWFKDINFGIPRELLFAKGTEGMLNAAIIDIINETPGIQKITEFDSSVDVRTRIYTASFTAITDSGEIISLEGLEVT